MDNKQILRIVSACIIAISFLIILITVSTLKPIQPKTITYESLLAELEQ